MKLTRRSSDDEEDEAAELMRELEKIKKERQEQKEKEVYNPSPNKDAGIFSYASI